MTIKERYFYWLIIIISITFFLFQVREILLPFFLGGVVAYFLNPIIYKLKKIKLSRCSSSALLTVFFYLIIGILVISVVPIFYEQVTILTKKMPEYRASLNTKFIPKINNFTDMIDPIYLSKAQGSLEDIMHSFVEFITGFLTNLFKSSLNILNLISLIFITPIITFYLLNDWERMISKLKLYMPVKYKEVMLDELKKIDTILSAYIRGQTLVCLALACYYGLSLQLIHLNYGFLIGCLTGMLAFIPYVGAAMGIVLAVIMAILQFGTLSKVMLVITIFIIGQVVEGNFITPKLVGDRIGVHPVFMLFAMLAGAVLFGFIGVLLAVPTAAIIGVLIRFMLAKYLKSSLYTGN
jgi:predicted PurR-regulated permease PerM